MINIDNKTVMCIIGEQNRPIMYYVGYGYNDGQHTYSIAVKVFYSDFSTPFEGDLQILVFLS